MNVSRGALVAGFSLACLVAGALPSLAVASTPSAAAADGTPVLLTELKFNSTTLNASPGWAIGANNGASISVQPTSSPAGNGNSVYALEGSYPAPFPNGAQYLWATYSLATLNTEDIYIEFWAKMPGVKEGCKFVKIFGEHLPNNSYANTTFATNYTGGDYGALSQISFGDGTTLANDSQQVIDFNGQGLKYMGRSYGIASVQTPQMRAFSSTDWGNGWHHFRIHVKFNSGSTAQSEVPDGEYYLEIDGKVYVNATGVYNRNPANGPIDRVEFFGWAQSESQPFQLWYDDIRISTGGFASQPTPMPPNAVVVK